MYSDLEQVQTGPPTTSVLFFVIAEVQTTMDLSLLPLPREEK